MKVLMRCFLPILLLVLLDEPCALKAEGAMLTPLAPDATALGTAINSSTVTSAPTTPNSTTNTSSFAASVDSGKLLQVGIAERPPYSMKDEKGEWRGIGPDLWEEIAKKLGVKFQYEECLQSEMHQKLKDHQIDMILVIGQSVDFLGAEDFTQPYVYSHGAAVIGFSTISNTIENIMKHLVQSGVFFIMLIMFIAMVLISLVLVHFEGRQEDGHFIESDPMKRFASALWFTAVTMTCIGYGDSEKLSTAGRTITFLWMMMGILFISLFTGTVVSSITTSELNASLTRIEDLSRYRCGVFSGAKMEKVLLSKGIPVRRYPTLMEGFGALQRGQISAFAVDAISATTIVNNEYPGQFKVCVMPTVQLLYSFAFRKNDPLFDQVNNEVIRTTLSTDWRSRIERWSGPIDF
jgi:ABC-type amino acid transport substrate-binding protein